MMRSMSSKKNTIFSFQMKFMYRTVYLKSPICGATEILKSEGKTIILRVTHNKYGILVLRFCSQITPDIVNSRLTFNNLSHRMELD